MMYARLPGQKSDYGKAAQTGVSFTSGYLAGILCGKYHSFSVCLDIRYNSAMASKFSISSRSQLLN